MATSPRRPGSEQRKPMQFPLIPPLPPSNAYDKENQRQSEAHNRNNNIGSHKKPSPSELGGFSSSSLTLTPQSRNSTLGLKLLSAQRESYLSSSPSQPVMRRHSQGSKRRVLRYGETVESLFCLAENSTLQHRTLCRDIAEGPLADDPSAWLRAVQAATKEVAKNADNKEQIGADLIRLHRRATSRFSTLSENEMLKGEDCVFELWLSYAQVQALYGSAEDARLTFRHIQNQNLGVRKAVYYRKFAEFERQYDTSRAIQILKNGMEQNAEPRQVLQDAINEIQPTDMSSNAARLYTVSSALVLESKKRKSEQETSPKRLRMNDGSVKDVLPLSLGTDSSKPSEKTGAQSHLQLALNTAHRSNEKVSFAEGTASEPIRAKAQDALAETKTPTRPQLTGGTGRPAFGSVSVFKNSQKKPSLITKTPRLSRVGLSGKPMRVNAVEDPASDSDSSMDTATRSETLDAKALLENIADSMDITATRPAPKITKMDLSYMLNWDPNARKRPSISPKRERNDVAPRVACEKSEEDKKTTPPTENSEEEPSNASAASVVTSTLTSLHSNAAKTSHSHITTHTNRSDESDEAIHQPTTIEPTATLDQTAALVAKSNPDFLPLVCQDNILRVNNKPYAKLGVIGKGGSCKVYRALAKDCSILAIKKVKLGGMDKKAINGYANEIALLKRLRGNPSIIQMYDSEVDLSRKAIFVAMELGEVDLNQVIQQQTVDSAKDGKRCRSTLDMNFIRLTWQQMLKAVHSIHEERIIHGDLKPANFLFVRGALKLIDFGIAKAIQSDDTTNIYRDSQIGTLNYMSPEAILDTGSGANGARMKIGRASDIWSLGCILYQLVYGRTPFADLHMIQKLQAIVNPNHKITYPPGVEDEGAVDAMQLCLRRAPEERPPIVGENGLLNEHCFLNTRRRAHPV